MDQTTEQELRALLDRDRILALMNRYFATIDDATGLDADWSRSIFSEDVPVEHREADAVRTAEGWRFQTLALRSVWSRGTSHFDIAGSEQ
jgi:hypothetical protein